MSFWDRIKRIGNAQANSIVDTMEDPVKMSQQIIRDLQDNLQEAINGTADMKALAAGHRASEMENRQKAKEWEDKANAILDRVDKKSLDEAEGNKLAADCLKSQQDYLIKAEQFKGSADREDKSVELLTGKVEEIRQRISDTKNKASEIESRAKAANAEEKVNKTLSSVDTDGLMQTLDRMDQKTKATEFRAAAYAEIDSANGSSESKVNKILSETSPSDALAALKAKRNSANPTS